MNNLWTVIDAWVENARAKMQQGALTAEDLELLRTTLRPLTRPKRQRLLYLHAREPVVTAEVIAWSLYPGDDPGALPADRPYATVLAAIQDGWQAIHFPQQLAPFDDREADIVGFEFILQKWETVDG